LMLWRLNERLWVKPFFNCLASIGVVFLAAAVDRLPIKNWAPVVEPSALESLLSIMAASMLAIATFAVASMVSAYASASTTATPRSFPLVVSDDVSQNALSVFIGSFIFSIVGLSAVKNNLLANAGIFVLFTMTMLVFGLVIFIFVRWMDSIARLGRLGTTIDRAEKATAKAISRRLASPVLAGVPRTLHNPPGARVWSADIGYVQHIDMGALQALAEKLNATVYVDCLPGAFATPARPLAFMDVADVAVSHADMKAFAHAFSVGGDRVFDDDPRFGFIVLSEIAGRALSPAVNDPGTAVDILGTNVRLLSLWAQKMRTYNEALHAGDADDQDDDPNKASDKQQGSASIKAPVNNGSVKFDRVQVPYIAEADLLDDAFTAIARDGAGSVEVCLRLQKALQAVAVMGNPGLRAAALQHSGWALERALQALTLEHDRTAVKAAAAQVGAVLLP
jgi:uncharacterized membrane protein